MKRFLACAGAGMLIAGSALAPRLEANAAGNPPTIPAGQLTYLTGMFTPAAGTMAGGVALLIGQTGTGANDRNPNAQNQTNATATLAIQASGLKPSTTYSVAIGSGACGTTTSSGNNGAGSSTAATPSSTLPKVTADVGGDAMVVATKVGYQVTPKSAVEVSLRSGTPVAVAACATLQTPRWIVGLKPMDGSMTSGVALITPNVPVLNGAVKTGTEVVVYATGLQPHTVQPNHIHAGPCNTSSAVLIPLTTLVTDGSGRAVEGTGIPYSLNLTGSIHIHRNNFLPEACGDLTAKSS